MSTTEAKLELDYPAQQYVEMVCDPAGQTKSRFDGMCRIPDSECGTTMAFKLVSSGTLASTTGSSFMICASALWTPTGAAIYHGQIGYSAGGAAPTAHTDIAAEASATVYAALWRYRIASMSVHVRQVADSTSSSGTCRPFQTPFGVYSYTAYTNYANMDDWCWTPPASTAPSYPLTPGEGCTVRWVPSDPANLSFIGLDSSEDTAVNWNDEGHYHFPGILAQNFGGTIEWTISTVIEVQCKQTALGYSPTPSPYSPYFANARALVTNTNMFPAACSANSFNPTKLLRQYSKPIHAAIRVAETTAPLVTTANPTVGRGMAAAAAGGRRIMIMAKADERKRNKGKARQRAATIEDYVQVIESPVTRLVRDARRRK